MARCSSTLVAPSVRPSARAISRLSMPEREAHDQRLAAVVRQLLHALEDSRELVAALDQVLGRVRSRASVPASSIAVCGLRERSR